MTMQFFVTWVPTKNSWLFIDKLYFMSRYSKISYTVSGYLLTFIHYYMLLTNKKMEAIALTVMLEQEDIVISTLRYHIDLKSKTEKNKKTKKRSYAYPPPVYVDTSSWKSEDTGTIDLS
jgi:hypothetical protein